MFFFTDPATTVIYTYRPTLSLHDALPVFFRSGGVTDIQLHVDSKPYAELHHLPVQRLAGVQQVGSLRALDAVGGEAIRALSCCLYERARDRKSTRLSSSNS